MCLLLLNIILSFWVYRVAKVTKITFFFGISLFDLLDRCLKMVRRIFLKDLLLQESKSINSLKNMHIWIEQTIMLDRKDVICPINAKFHCGIYFLYSFIEMCELRHPIQRRPQEPNIFRPNVSSSDHFFAYICPMTFS